MTPAPTIISRAAWGARPPRSRTTLNPTWGTTAHYNGGPMWGNSPPSSWNHGACPTKVRAIQRYHMDTQRWADAAYSYIVCPHGLTYELRGLGVRTGANGTNQGNATSYAVMLLIGGDEPVTAAMAAEFVAVVNHLRRGGRAGPNLGPHSHWKATACPGVHGRQLVERCNSGWRPNAGPPVPESAPHIGELARGEEIHSGNGATVFAHQRDGNVVLYRHGIPTWATRTHGRATTVLTMQDDGNLALYGPHGAIWSTRTDGYQGAQLRVQNDGNAVIYLGDRPLWSAWGARPPVARPTIRRGATGDHVRHAQLRLTAHGHGGQLAPSGADGIFGAKTEAAVREFQTSHRLARDGVVGPKTWAALG